jgi:hypothetical protein
MGWRTVCKEGNCIYNTHHSNLSKTWVDFNLFVVIRNKQNVRMLQVDTMSSTYSCRATWHSSSAKNDFHHKKSNK